MKNNGRCASYISDNNVTITHEERKCVLYDENYKWVFYVHDLDRWDAIGTFCTEEKEII